ncbi:MAG: flagellar type III secretion system pore protein FliP [Alphaproteobacteria bacterium]|nr:flagellar type III secretion system pore protein FliP [Alphaproteobacteria bacterium]
MLAAMAAGGVLLLAAVPALAQSITIDLGGGASAGSATARIVQVLVLLTVLSLAPSLLVMVTSFARMVIALSLLRTAIGAQGVPPNPVLIALALFLTGFVMAPAFEQAWAEGLAPMSAGTLGEIDGLIRAADPFRRFMLANTRGEDVRLFLDLGRMAAPELAAETPWRAILPAFLISELRRAFEIGFLLYLPFLVIDLVVASVLMSMGMMMLPPVTVSLPLKLVFFVLVDGWHMVAGALVQGFATA